jgi:hypothetical protein
MRPTLSRRFDAGVTGRSRRADGLDIRTRRLHNPFMIGCDTASIVVPARVPDGAKEHVMHARSPFRAVVFLLLVLAGAAGIGVAAFTAGVQHGFVEAGRSAAVLPEGTTHVHVWPGPWPGGYFPVFPLIAGFVLVLFVLRGFAWRGGRGRGRGCGPRRVDGVPPAFDEWHRRAHERMAGAPPPPSA